MDFFYLFTHYLNRNFTYPVMNVGGGPHVLPISDVNNHQDMTYDTWLNSQEFALSYYVKLISSHTFYQKVIFFKAQFQDEEIIFLKNKWSHLSILFRTFRMRVAFILRTKTRVVMSRCFSTTPLRDTDFK